jgi:stress response protein YsnF
MPSCDSCSTTNQQLKGKALYGPDTEMRTEIPLYAEEIIISKRKVTVGKMVIRKRQVTEEHTIDVE